MEQNKGKNRTEFRWSDFVNFREKKTNNLHQYISVEFALNFQLKSDESIKTNFLNGLKLTKKDSCRLILCTCHMVTQPLQNVPVLCKRTHLTVLFILFYEYDWDVRIRAVYLFMCVYVNIMCVCVCVPWAILLAVYVNFSIFYCQNYWN